jgi:hypothetical protein
VHDLQLAQDLLARAFRSGNVHNLPSDGEWRVATKTTKVGEADGQLGSAHRLPIHPVRPALTYLFSHDCFCGHVQALADRSTVSASQLAHHLQILTPQVQLELDPDLERSQLFT